MTLQGIDIIVASIVFCFLVIDLTFRWRGRDCPSVDLADAKRFLPLPVLAVLGGISAHAGCGWLGWGLLVTAGLCAADAIVVAQVRAGSPWERAIIIRSILIFEAAVIALSSVKIANGLCHFW